MNIAIVDDLESEAQKLSGFITKYCDEHFLRADIRAYESGSKLLDDLQPPFFDVLFLDIFMKDMNGLDLARSLRDRGYDNLIVFSTISTDYAVNGYSVQAFDYLVKPYDYDRFHETMDRCMEELSNKSRYIVVKESRTYVKIRLDNIIYTDYHNHYIQIHTPVRVVKSYMSFSDFSKLLEPYPQFLNCYRNCIVNMDHVAALKGYEFILKNGDIMPITRNRKTDIRQKYADYEFYRLEKESKP
ncbi:LytTR family DNA-binding domain-containing protein [Anaerovorax odorimutans]|uniref:Stage 0 sporulation protein A homolog n=1 Tax=Anaerovorax odorimutans TaxID=109327 RepID=A0ABT1RQF0_9FIRM|nr:LytTR family DNA-binding domain-containing protein [Anaerovorax odorimutans]MCQ4637396.1 LytTR family DNA-binding domain-containing protein [Anaerovorax odorimutans]